MRVLLAAFVVIIGAAAAAVYGAAFIVHQNEQALVLRFGEPKQLVRDPGLHWKMPVIDTVDYFDKRILDLDTAEQEVTASDQKRLKVDAFARYRIVNALLFYQRVREERNVRSRLGPIVESSLRRVLGSSTFQNLVRDNREDLMRKIAQQVNDEAKDLGLEIVDVRIKRADLPQANSEAIYKRMQTERQREAQEFRAEGTAEKNRVQANADREVTVIKAEANRKAELTRGEGDGERNRIFAEAYNRDPEFFGFYRSMQSYEQAMRQGDTRFVISPDSDKFREYFKYFSNPTSGTPSAPAQVRPGQPAGR